MPTNGGGSEDEDTTDSERRHQPELSRAKPVEPNKPIENEFEIDPRDDADEDAARLSRMNQTMRQVRSEEHTSELQSLMRISYAVFCLKKKKKHTDRLMNTLMSTREECTI